MVASGIFQKVVAVSGGHLIGNTEFTPENSY